MNGTAIAIDRHRKTSTPRIIKIILFFDAHLITIRKKKNLNIK